MKNLLFALLTFGSLMTISAPLMAQGQLANPGFEEDVANVGNPDGWSIHKDAKVKVVSGQASQGSRALLVEDGYVAVFQDLSIAELAGRTVSLSVDAKGLSPNAVIGARIGYMSQDNKWRDAPLLWDKPITGEYQTYTAQRILPADAKAGRLYIGFYRSDKKSSFYLDNVQLLVGTGLNVTQTRRAVALARDANYFLNRLNNAEAAQLPQPLKQEWQERAKSIVDEATAARIELANRFEQHEATIHKLNAALFQTLAGDKTLLVNWAPPHERLEPDALPVASTNQTQELTALRGEYRAFGLDVANGTSAPQNIILQVRGLPSNAQLSWRRQVFTETWYTKGKTLLADPLPLLPSRDGTPVLSAPTGELIRLYGEIETSANTPAGKHSITIELIENGIVRQSRTLVLDVAAKAAPPQRMGHYQFLYSSSPIVNNHTAEAAKDLEAYGVTDIEWPFMPPAVFDTKGNLQKVDFTFYDRMLKEFGPTKIRLNVFWQSSYKKFQTADGTTLELLSPEWKNAFTQVFQAWLDHAQKQGVGNDRITILLADEIHSKSLENAPDDGIKQLVEIFHFFKEKFPRIKHYLTLSYYAFPKDVAAALPYVDVMMPHLPQPPSLSRNAPPTYSPQNAFAEEIYPMLREEQKKRPLDIWSYHVVAGRSDDVNLKAPWSRGYPLLAAATGHTGIGYWAYNVSSGSTWDDTDGNILDYNFVYDGGEKHPLNLKYNPTGEKVVPSLRWKAVRAGLQDADLYLALQAQPRTSQIATLLETIQKMQGAGESFAPNLTTAQLEIFSRQLRESYR